LSTSTFFQLTVSRFFSVVCFDFFFVRLKREFSASTVQSHSFEMNVSAFAYPATGVGVTESRRGGNTTEGQSPLLDTIW
jgi:hypothetical protein